MIFVNIHVCCDLLVKNHLKGALVASHLRLKPTKVKVILNIILVYFAKEFIALQAAEPLNPRSFLSLAFRDVL